MVSLSSLLKRKGYSSKVLLKQTRGFLYRERFIFYVWHFHTAFRNLQNDYFRGFVFMSGELFKEHLFLKRSCSCFFSFFWVLFSLLCSSFFLVSWLSPPELTKPASWLSLTFTAGLVTETEYMINVWHWPPHPAGNWSLPYILYMLLLNMCDCYWCSNCLSVCISVL